MELDLRTEALNRESVDRYLTALVEQYYGRRSCTIRLSAEPSGQYREPERDESGRYRISSGMEAVWVLTHEESWNEAGPWRIVVGDKEYTYQPANTAAKSKHIMSRTIKQIYEEAVTERNKRLELAEFSSDSKLSVLNGITWVAAAVIYTFESLMDVFAVDIADAINERVNGTPAYYANALLQYQQGDELTVREDGLAFGYGSVDETKRIITQVSYVESTDDQNLDSKLILKVATGPRGKSWNRSRPGN